MLVFPNGRATWDSTSILKRLGLTYPKRLRVLYPHGMEAHVEAMENFFDANLGPHTRQWQYFYTLRDEALAKQFFTRFCAAVERWLFPFVFPDLRKGLGRALHLDDEHKNLSLQEIDQVRTGWWGPGGGGGGGACPANSMLVVGRSTHTWHVCSAMAGSFCVAPISQPPI